MSMGPMAGIGGSAAGAPLAQTRGSETERSQQDAAAHERQVRQDQHAENVAGVGQTEQDEQASDRDADGRRLWERQESSSDSQDEAASQAPERLSKDPTGQSGNVIDLTG